MVLHLGAPPGEPLLDLCRGRVSQQLAEAGARVLGWYASEHAPNNFPRLPVREGEEVLLGLAMFDTAAALEAFTAGWQFDVEPLLQPWLARPAEMLRLAPTARSALRG